MSKKSLMIAAAITTLGATGALGLQTVNAATSTAANPHASLVQKIADKFNLNRDDVQGVFDAQRTEMEANREQEMKDKLAQAVKDGKITQDQVNKITTKLAEMKTNRISLKDKTKAERQAATKTAHDALVKWAQDNNIPMEYLRLGHGGPQGGGSATTN